MGQNASKLVLTHAKDQVEVGRNFFTFTFKAVAVTFLKVIFHLPRNAPIWSFWISMEVVSYLSPPVFLTSLPHHCYIPQHYLSLHGGYWCKKTWSWSKFGQNCCIFCSSFIYFPFSDVAFCGTNATDVLSFQGIVFQGMWEPQSRMATMLRVEKIWENQFFTGKMECHGTKYTQNQWRHMSESFGLVRSCFRGPPPFGLTLIGLPENFQLDLSYLDLDYLHLDLGSLQKKRPFE